MHKAIRYLLPGVFALAFILFFGTRYFGAKPASRPLPVSTASAPETDAAAVEPAQGSVPQAATLGQIQALLSANGCLDCHAFDKKVIGPAYRDVAARYKDDEQALEKVIASIRNGSVERWGDAVMPAMPNLSESQAKLLAEYVLQ